MSFFDVNIFERSKFDQIIKQGKYRGGREAYPLGYRRYSERHFRIENDGSYAVWYADRQTMDEYLNGNRPDMNQWYAHRLLGKLHPDNSFEIINCSGQGDAMLLSTGLNMWVHQVSKKDGLVIENKKYAHPAFIGLRIGQDGEAVTPYKLFVRKTKRKTVNTYMAQLKTPINAAFTMLSAMTPRNINEIYVDLAHEFGGTERPGDNLYKVSMKDVHRLAAENRIVDALCLYTLAARKRGYLIRVWEITALLRDPTSTTCVDTLRDNYVRRMRVFYDENFTHDFIRSIEGEEKHDLFKFEEISTEGNLPSATWGYLIEREDGQPAIRL